MNELTITINIAAEAFANWLKDYTAGIYLDFFPMSKGGCTLQPARGPLAGDGPAPGQGALTMVIDAFYWDGELPRSGSVHPWQDAIVFEIVALAADRIEVSLRCQYEAIKPYYHDLLVAILMRWPETQTQLAHVDITDIESGAKAAWAVDDNDLSG